jgi:ribonuclease D
MTSDPAQRSLPQIPEQVITRPEELAACCSHLTSCRQFGFDTEFVGEETYHPRLCLVQVATAERLYLIDPLAVGPLDAFWKLVVDPANLVIVHAGREEVRLCRLWSGQAPANLFDLQLAAGLIGLGYPLGHGALVNHLFGIQIPKAETLTEWRDRPLTRAQIRYAFDDVRYLLPAWQYITRRLEELGRSDWAREEFTRLAAAGTPEEVPTEKWRKLRGLGALDQRQLAVVRALYYWRDETAARLNRPARTVVRDDLLIEITRRNPVRERDLSTIRGLPRRDLPAILQTVEQARALPLEQCPLVVGREQDVPQVALVSSVLQAVLANLCARQALAPNLVATSQDVKLLVRARLHGVLPTESPLTQGWRCQHVLPELMAVMEGRRSLRIADLSADTPFVLDEVDGRELPPDKRSDLR